MTYKKGKAGFLLAAICIVASFSAPASAAFPGLNGRVVFSSNRDGDNEIFTMRLDGSDVQQLTNNTFSDIEPSWSSDGKKITFTSNKDTGSNNQIYVMNTDGSSVQRLTTSGGIDSQPRWSPNGNKIAFHSTRDHAQPEIYIMNIDGSGVQRLTTNTVQDANPSFLSNNVIVFATRRDGNKEVYSMGADGSSPVNLTNYSAVGNDDNTPVANLSGSLILFSATRTDTFGQIYRMNIDGSSQTKLTNHIALASLPFMSPENNLIVFADSEGGDVEISRMNADGTAITKLTDNTFTDTYPSIQPLTILPTLTPDTAPAITAGDAVTVSVVANDTDTYESIDPTTLTIVSVSSGTATANPDGTITYQSVLGYAGTAQVTYRVCSTANPNLCNTSVLSISVTSAGQLAATGQSSLLLLLGALTITLLSAFGFRRITR